MVFGKAALGLSYHPRSPRDEQTAWTPAPTPPTSRDPQTPEHRLPPPPPPPPPSTSLFTRPSGTMERRHSFPETRCTSTSDLESAPQSLPLPKYALPIHMDRLYPSKSSGDPRISPLDSVGGTQPVAPTLLRRQSEGFLEYKLPKTPPYSFIPLPTVTASNTPIGTPAASPELGHARLRSAHRRMSNASITERLPKRWATPSSSSTPQPPPLLPYTPQYQTPTSTLEQYTPIPTPSPPSYYAPGSRVAATRGGKPTKDLDGTPARSLSDTPVAPQWRPTGASD